MKRAVAALMAACLFVAVLSSCTVTRSGGAETTAPFAETTAGTPAVGTETPAETTVIGTEAPAGTSATETTAPAETTAPESSPAQTDDEYTKNY